MVNNWGGQQWGNDGATIGQQWGNSGAVVGGLLQMQKAELDAQKLALAEEFKKVTTPLTPSYRGTLLLTQCPPQGSSPIGSSPIAHSVASSFRGVEGVSSS